MAQIINNRRGKRWSEQERTLMFDQLKSGMLPERVAQNLGRTSRAITSQFASICLMQTQTLDQLQQQYPQLDIRKIMSQQQALDERDKNRDKSQQQSLMMNGNNQDCKTSNSATSNTTMSSVVKKEDEDEDDDEDDDTVLIEKPIESLHAVMTQILQELREIKDILREQKSK